MRFQAELPTPASRGSWTTASGKVTTPSTRSERSRPQGLSSAPIARSIGTTSGCPASPAGRRLPGLLELERVRQADAVDDAPHRGVLADEQSRDAVQQRVALVHEHHRRLRDAGEQVLREDDREQREPPPAPVVALPDEEQVVAVARDERRLPVHEHRPVPVLEDVRVRPVGAARGAHQGVQTAVHEDEHAPPPVLPARRLGLDRGHHHGDVLLVLLRGHRLVGEEPAEEAGRRPQRPALPVEHHHVPRRGDRRRGAGRREREQGGEEGARAGHRRRMPPRAGASKQVRSG